MRAIRNKAVHVHLSNETAIEYSEFATTIVYQINNITNLPKVKLTALTLLILELNHLIDTGEFNDITIEQIGQEIEAKNTLFFLKERTKGKADFSLYSNDGPYSGFSEYYHEELCKIYGGYAGQHQRKWGVKNIGLCLLLAYTNELVQQGAGWYPSEEL